MAKDAWIKGQRNSTALALSHKMYSAHVSLDDAKRANEQRLGLGVVAELRVHACKIAEQLGDLGMVGANGLLHDLDGPEREGRRALVIAHILAEAAQLVQLNENVDVVSSEECFAQLE